MRTHNVRMLKRLSELLGALRPRRRRRTEADRAQDRLQDAKRGLLDSRAMDARGKLLDFESDSERPRY